MKPYLKLLQPTLLLLILIILPACSSPATQKTLLAVSPTYSNPPSATPGPTLDSVQTDLATRIVRLDQTATVHALTPSPTATSTRTRIPTRPPTNTPTPKATGAPLPEANHWLLLAKTNSDTSTLSYFILDPATGAQQPANLPELPKSFEWWPIKGGKGPYMAFRAGQLTLNPHDLVAKGIDDYLWILKIPENQITAKIPLLGENAWQSIKDQFATTLYDLAPVLPGLMADKSSFLWSPNGRYLAFPAAVDSKGADIYLYDAVTTQVKRLTFGFKGAHPWLWSEDSQHLIFQEGDIYEVSWGLQEHATEVWVIDLAGSQRKLYSPDSYEEAGTTTSQEFVVYDTCFECEEKNLRQVNFLTGTIKTLYEGFFPSYAFDPVTATLLLNFDDSSSWGQYPYHGIMKVNLANGNLNNFYPGQYDNLSWHKSAGVFSAEQADPNLTSESIFFTPSGNQVFKIPDAHYFAFPSPNGSKILADIVPGLAEMASYWLFDRSGQLIVTTPGTHPPVWMPDSKSFYIYWCEGPPILLRYSEVHQWQQETIFEGNASCKELYLIYPSIFGLP